MNKPKRNLKVELLLPKSMKWTGDTMEWEKKGGHSGREACVRVIHAATLRGWKRVDPQVVTAQSGNVRSIHEFTDGVYKLRVEHYVGDTSADNRFYIKVTEIKKSESV